MRHTPSLSDASPRSDRFRCGGRENNFLAALPFSAATALRDNASIALFTVVTKVFGLIATETANSITFKLTDGTTHPVLRKEIAALQSTRASLMPAGLEAALDLQKLADLIAFLRTGNER